MKKKMFDKQKLIATIQEHLLKNYHALVDPHYISDLATTCPKEDFLSDKKKNKPILRWCLSKSDTEIARKKYIDQHAVNEREILYVINKMHVAASVHIKKYNRDSFADFYAFCAFCAIVEACDRFGMTDVDRETREIDLTDMIKIILKSVDPKAKADIGDIKRLCTASVDTPICLNGDGDSHTFLFVTETQFVRVFCA